MLFLDEGSLKVPWVQGPVFRWMRGLVLRMKVAVEVSVSNDKFCSFTDKLVNSGKQNPMKIPQTLLFLEPNRHFVVLSQAPVVSVILQTYYCMNSISSFNWWCRPSKMFFRQEPPNQHLLLSVFGSFPTQRRFKKLRASTKHEVTLKLTKKNKKWKQKMQQKSSITSFVFL